MHMHGYNSIIQQTVTVNCTRHYTTVGHSCKNVRQYAESAYQQNKMAAMP